jgi:hypothetical protein
MAASLIFALSLTALGASFVFIEAESGQNNGMGIIDDGAAYSGKCIVAQTTDDTIEYAFDIENAGKYVIWARVYGVDSTMNSFLYSMDGERFNDAMLIFDLYELVDLSNTDDPYYDPVISTDEMYEQWYWMRVNWRDNSDDPAIWHNTKIFDLSAGSHSLLFQARELESRIDKMIITDDLGYDPKTISGDPEVPYREELARLAAEKAAAEAAEAAANETPEEPVAPAEPPPPAPAVPQTSDNAMVLVLVCVLALAAVAAAKGFKIKKS